MVRAPAHRGRRLLAAGAAALLAPALSGTALAEPSPSIELDWTAPPGCPERRAVLAEAEQLLAMSSGAGGVAAVEAKAVISRQGATWALDLEIPSSAGPGRRHLQDESCQRLAQVAALALALAAHSPAPARPARAVEESERRAQAPAPRFLARALLAGDFGSLRAPGPGPGIAFGLFLGRGRAEATLGYWSATSAGGARDQLLSGGLRACTGLLEHPELDLCLGAELGCLRAGASGESRPASGTWLALLAGPALGFELASWLAVRLEIDLGAALLRPAFAASGPESPGTSANFGRVAAGLEARF